MITVRLPLATLLITGYMMAGGCATSPETNYYGLSTIAQPSSSFVTRRATIGVGPINLAPYLESDRIAIRDENNRIKLDEFNRWAGRLDQELQNTWVDSLSRLLPSTRIYPVPNDAVADFAYRVVADVTNFEVIQGQGAKLSVRWTVLDGATNKPVLTDRKTYLQPLRELNTIEIVKGLNLTANSFSQDLAQQLAFLPKLRSAR